MDHLDFLSALASVCDAAKPMPVYQQQTTATSKEESPTHSLTYSEEAFSSPHAQTAAAPTTNQSHKLTTFLQPQTPTRPHPDEESVLVPFPTPPLTPFSSKPFPSAPNASTTPVDSSTLEQQVGLICQEGLHALHPNPLMRNVIAFAQFTQFLDETWPEESARRGSAVIRASLYSKIADALRGGPCSARFRYWIKKSGFFLIESAQPDGTYGACLAIPAPSKKQGQQFPQLQYRLVARLEDFVYVIGFYHNDEKGHAGIRKTYSLIQTEFSYLPRTAVAKFIELCDNCCVRVAKHKGGKPKKCGTKRKRSEETTIQDNENVAEDNENADQENENASKKSKIESNVAEKTAEEQQESEDVKSTGVLSEVRQIITGLKWEDLVSLYTEASEKLSTDSSS